jgi:hypothetical protein
MEHISDYNPRRSIWTPMGVIDAKEAFLQRRLCQPAKVPAHATRKIVKLRDEERKGHDGRPLVEGEDLRLAAISLLKELNGYMKPDRAQ